MCEFKWLLAEERWKQSGFETKTAFVNSIDFSHLRVSVEQRKEIAKLLIDEGASQRSTARMLGVDVSTVRGELGKRRAVYSAKASGEAAKSQPDKIANTKIPHSLGSRTPPTLASSRSCERRARRSAMPGWHSTQVLRAKRRVARH